MSPATASLASLIAGGTATLAAAGIAEPRREALALWGAVAGVPAGEAALAALESRMAPATAGVDQRSTRAVERSTRAAAQYHRAIARRAGGEPLAYVTGQAGFRHLSLRVDRRVLIPRPETELLVELALARVSSGVACDVGTGSGCIALSLAYEGRFECVLALDWSADALALAHENARQTGIAVALVRSDLTAALRPGSVDLLVANPPYLSEAEWAALDPSVKDWEPQVALPSGADGMAATNALLRDGKRVLRPGGWLALEVDCERAGATRAGAHALGWSDVELVQDLFGRERYLLARTERSS